MAEASEDKKLMLNIADEPNNDGRGISKADLAHYEQLLREYREAEVAKTSYLHHCKTAGAKGADIGGFTGEIVGGVGAGVTSAVTKMPIPSDVASDVSRFVFSGIGYVFGCGINVGYEASADGVKAIGNGVNNVGGLLKGKSGNSK